MIRGIWRLLCAVIAGGAAFVMWPDWGLLWLTQKASFLALGVIVLCIAAVAMGLAIVSIRWLLLACWPGPLGIQITPETISMRVGPFGRRMFDWSQLRMELDESVDPDLVDLLPDDAFVPRVLHLATAKDLVPDIIKFAGISHEEITRRLRDYLKVHGIKNSRV